MTAKKKDRGLSADQEYILSKLEPSGPTTADANRKVLKDMLFRLVGVPAAWFALCIGTALILGGLLWAFPSLGNALFWLFSHR
jgi:hypothetical protein